MIYQFPRKKSKSRTFPFSRDRGKIEHSTDMNLKRIRWPSSRQKMSIGRAILKYGETETESFNEEIGQTLVA